MKTCPVCGHTGNDLVFSFYCSNPICQNYVASKNSVESIPVQQESKTKYFFYKKPKIITPGDYIFRDSDKSSITKNDRVLGSPVKVPQEYPIKDLVLCNFSKAIEGTLKVNLGKYIESKNVSSRDLTKNDTLISLPIQTIKTVHKSKSPYDYLFHFYINRNNK